jgi:transcriptional regulator with XRE-family HTH domain
MDREQRTARQQELCEKMVTYLPLLRKSLGITQNGLAKKLGVTRPTVMTFESCKRPLLFPMYLALVSVFMAHEDSRKIMEAFELFDRDFMREIE